ncbi:MAG: hypothetical protein R3F46_06860 [bacterium]
MLPPPAILLVTGLILLQTCRIPGAAADTPQATLEYSAGQLIISQGELRRELAVVQDLRSFCWNPAAGGLAISTVDDELRPQSWLVPDSGRPAVALPGMLPLHFAADYTAFASPAASEYEPAPEQCVYGASAQELWRSQLGSLLLPGTGPEPLGGFCTFSWEAVDDLSTMYIEPGIELHSSADGGILNHWELPLDFPPADVELLSMDDRQGLLLVLMDIYSWHIVRLDRSSNQASIIHSLSGQPMYDQFLPGRDQALSHLMLRDGLLEIDVIDLAAGNLRLLIEPGSGSVQTISGIDGFPRNRNQHFAESSPEIPFPHLLQNLIPAEIGSVWRMPACLDQTGTQVLLLGASGTFWQDLE